MSGPNGLTVASYVDGDISTVGTACFVQWDMGDSVRALVTSEYTFYSYTFSGVHMIPMCCAFVLVLVFALLLLVTSDNHDHDH